MQWIEETWTAFLALIAPRGMHILRAAVIIAVALVIARVVRRIVTRLLSARLPPAQLVVGRTLAGYIVYGLAGAWALKELGFDLGVLLGAAGVLSVAIGFASQTSVSNLVSGLFIIGEQPFKIGDVIKVDDITGEVLSVDLLSVKLRTFDNLYVRVPNENMIKTKVTTLTRYPIRRIDLTFGVAYKEDISHVKRVLDQVADGNATCFEEPKPLFIVLGFGASSVDLQYSVWARRERFVETRNELYSAILRAFAAEKIEIPFPHVSLYRGEVTEPFPIRVVPSEPQPPSDSSA